MTVAGEAGPFRSDARERRFAHAVTDAAAAGRFLWSVLAYLGTLLGGAVAASVHASSPWPLAAAVVLGFLAWPTCQYLWTGWRQASKHGAEKWRVTVVPEGILVDGALGPGRYDWSAVRGVTTRGDRIRLDLRSGGVLVLVPEGPLAPLERAIRERVKVDLFDPPGRLLALLGALYVLCIVEALIALPP